MKTTLTSQLHTIRELSEAMPIPEEIKRFDLDRELKVFGLQNIDTDELVCVAVFLNESVVDGQIQLIYLYTEPALRRQKLMEKLLGEVCSVLKQEGIDSIFCKPLGYELDELWKFSNLAEKIGFEPLILEGFLLDYIMEGLDVDSLKKVKKLPSACKIKAIRDLGISDKKELGNNQFIQRNSISLKQNPESESQLLFLDDTQNGIYEPVIYLDVNFDYDGVPVFSFVERNSINEFSDILAGLLLYTITKCVQDNKMQSGFKVVVVGGKRNLDVQRKLGKASRQLRFQEYVLKLK